MMHDFEGLPSFPLCIDDELITTHGSLAQPSSRPSYMVGFVALAGIFQVIGECLLLTRQHSARSLVNHSGSLQWIERAQQRVNDILDRLPAALRPTAASDDIVHPHHHAENDPDDDIFSVQRANLLITAVSAKFELLNFKAMAGGSNVESEREHEGRRMYALLAATPIEHLAANGEAMRGKVLRIIISLLGTSETTFWNDEVKLWWDMYSRVQFVQVIPPNPADLERYEAAM